MSSKKNNFIVAETGLGKSAEILFNVFRFASTDAATSELRNKTTEKSANNSSPKTDDQQV